MNERVRGIEPPCAAWEAAVLPLNYTSEGIPDFSFSIADCNWKQSLPRNHVVGIVEICTLCRVCTEGPSDHSLAQSCGACPSIGSIRICKLIIVIAIDP